MKTLIKEVVKLLYSYFADSKYRTFCRLKDKYGNVKRYTPVNSVACDSYVYSIPDMPSFIWQYKEIWMDELYAFYPRNEKPVIYDCGSNIGVSLLYFAKMFPTGKIVAYEADEHLAEISIKNLEGQNIKHVQVNAKAVWKDDQGVSFIADGADGGHIDQTAVRRIPSVRLRDVLIKEMYIDLLKIDIEGAENVVLEDCKDSLFNIDNIFIEYHSFSGQSQALHRVLDILTHAGFRYYLQDIHPRKRPFIIENNNQSMDMQINIFGYRQQ